MRSLAVIGQAPEIRENLLAIGNIPEGHYMRVSNNTHTIPDHLAADVLLHKTGASQVEVPSRDDEYQLRSLSRLRRRPGLSSAEGRHRAYEYSMSAFARMGYIARQDGPALKRMIRLAIIDATKVNMRVPYAVDAKKRTRSQRRAHIEGHAESYRALLPHAGPFMRRFIESALPDVA